MPAQEMTPAALRKSAIETTNRALVVGSVAAVLIGIAIVLFWSVDSVGGPPSGFMDDWRFLGGFLATVGAIPTTLVSGFLVWREVSDMRAAQLLEAAEHQRTEHGG